MKLLFINMNGCINVYNRNKLLIGKITKNGFMTEKDKFIPIDGLKEVIKWQCQIK